MATNWMILLLLIRILDAFVNTCDPSNLVQIGKERNDTYYVFVITQVSHVPSNTIIRLSTRTVKSLSDVLTN